MANPGLVYFNNATTSFPKSPTSLDAYLRAINRIPQDSRHSTAGDADVDNARRLIASVIGCSSEEIFFAPDGTIGINEVIQGYLGPGDRCIVDNRSHNAVTRTLHGMAGVAWQVMPLISADEETCLSEIEKAAKAGPRLFCVTHASNVTGSIYAVLETIRAIRTAAPRAAVLVDASQSAGFANLDVLAVADFAVFPSHKHLHAPAGAAVLVVRRPLRQVLYGGTGSRSASLVTRGGAEYLTEVGTPNGPAILALAAALADDQVERASRSVVLRRLTRRLWSGLSAIQGIRLLGRGPDGERTGTVTFSSSIEPEGAWIPYLRSRNIIARGGLHCCPLFHNQHDLPGGTVRLSPSFYSTLDEVDYVVEAIGQFSKALS
jgi:cysteine desulfurase / selenocysteine lyase